jgi:hypothetical protein
MRLFQMLGVAAQAEGIRLRRQARSTARQAGWMAGAAVFIVAAIIIAHVAVIAQVSLRHGLPVAAGLVAAGDLLIGGLLAFLARRRTDPVAEEARLLRATMLVAARQRSPMRQVMGLGGGSTQLLGALAVEAIAVWLKSRRG